MELDFKGMSSTAFHESSEKLKLSKQYPITRQNEISQTVTTVVKFL